MSAHFIPFTMHAESGAWFGGFAEYWAGIQAWKALAYACINDEDLYRGIEDVDGWVHPDTVKEFANVICNLDTSTMPLPEFKYFSGSPREKQDELVRSCAASLKAVILDSAEKGRGILHFH